MFLKRAMPAALLAGCLTAVAFGQSFSNSSSISIPTSGTATPYPSNIAVSGLSGPITSVTVDFFGFSHTFPDDVGMVVQGPTGAALLVMDGGTTTAVQGINFTLSDSASNLIPGSGTWGSGTYKPTAYYTGDSFPFPGPGTAYNHPGPAGGNSATLGSTWNGTNGNGTWSLYVVDFVGGDSGSISGGWRLNFTTQVPEPASMAALALGGFGLIARRRRARK